MSDITGEMREAESKTGEMREAESKTGEMKARDTKIATRVVLYVLSAILFVGYLVILWMSFDTSGVDYTYEKYFLTQELAFFPSVEELKTYGVGAEINYANDGSILNQGKDWAVPDALGCRIENTEAHLFLYVPDATKALTLTLWADGGTIGATKESVTGENDDAAGGGLRVFANGTEIGVMALAGGDEKSGYKLTLQIPGGMLLEGENDFCLQVAETDSGKVRVYRFLLEE